MIASIEKNCVMCHHPKTQRSILQWVMIVWNIIRFVCGLPSGEHTDWIIVRIWSFNEFFTGPWYRNDWIWKFLSNTTNWWTGFQSVHPCQGEKTLKISWFAKMQFKNWIFFSHFSRLLANYTVWTFVYTLMRTFASRLGRKNSIHTTSQWICMQSLQSPSQKKPISITLLPRVTISTVISAMMYWL